MKVLVVEDDKILSNTICQLLKETFGTEQAFDGYEGYMLAKQNIYDIIVLDLMMPEMSGYEVLQKLRNDKIFTPVLILTAKDGLDDKLKGFNLGADDYLTKPFERQELIARIEAIIRRNNGSYGKNTIEFKDMQLNINNRTTTINGQDVNLFGKQFDMLEYLINYKDTILTKEQIFERIWGFDSETTTNVIEVYASSLRRELKKYGYDKYIKTIRGVGYMITEKGE